MSALITDERGEIGLLQILLAAAMMIGVLGATLAVFTSAEKLNRTANDRIATQDQARVALDQLTAQLRNLASPTPDQPQAIDRATAADLIFQTVDRVGPNNGLNAANVMRVRYCLGTTNTTQLYRQEQRWTTQATPAAPTSTQCPAPTAAGSWTSATVLADGVVNGASRSVFTYNASAATDISSVHARLFVDADQAREPGETVLSSGVFLRNQNRRPGAAFSADTTVRGKIVLNGASSSDPEGDPLTYVWYDGETKVGEGIRFDYTVTPGTTRQMKLKVFDLAGLQGDSVTQTVEVLP